MCGRLGRPILPLRQTKRHRIMSRKKPSFFVRGWFPRRCRKPFASGSGRRPSPPPTTPNGFHFFRSSETASTWSRSPSLCLWEEWRGRSRRKTPRRKSMSLDLRLIWQMRRYKFNAAHRWRYPPRSNNPPVAGISGRTVCFPSIRRP